MNRKDLVEIFYNGIANIYLHNKIKCFSEEAENVSALELGQKLIIETIIIVENVGMAAAVYIKFSDNGLAIGLIWGSFFLYFLGFCFRLGYYKFWYIWKNVLISDLKMLPSELSRIRNDREKKEDGDSLQPLNI